MVALLHAAVHDAGLHYVEKALYHIKILSFSNLVLGSPSPLHCTAHWNKSE